MSIGAKSHSHQAVPAIPLCPAEGQRKAFETSVWDRIDPPVVTNAFIIQREEQN